MSKNQIARDISYASSAQTKGGRAVIRVMENATGRLKLIRKVRGYDAEVAQGADFWRVITDCYKLNLSVIGGSLDAIPKTGPLIVVSNHPYGILDGLMMGRIMSQRRGGDFKFLLIPCFANHPIWNGLFCRFLLKIPKRRRVKIWKPANLHLSI